MKYLREIGVYQKEGDSLIKSIEIKISLDRIKEIITRMDKEVPLLLQVYELDKKEFVLFQKALPELSNINFEET